MRDTDNHPTPASSAGSADMPCSIHGTDYREGCDICCGAYQEREIERLRAALSEAEAERDKARDEAMDWYGCIAMAQETLDALIYLRRAEKGKAAMFLPEAIRNACVLVRDEALAYAEDGYQAALTAKDAELARLREAAANALCRVSEWAPSHVTMAALGFGPETTDCGTALANLRRVAGLEVQANRHVYVPTRSAARASTGTTAP